jgi:THO complex subunit 3
MNTVAWHPFEYHLAFAGDEKASDGSYAGNFKIWSAAASLST